MYVPAGVNFLESPFPNKCFPDPSTRFNQTADIYSDTIYSATTLTGLLIHSGKIDLVKNGR